MSVEKQIGPKQTISYSCNECTYHIPNMCVGSQKPSRRCTHPAFEHPAFIAYGRATPMWCPEHPERKNP